MANVVQCDVCGKIIELKDSRYVELGYNRYFMSRMSFQKDLCLDCYNKIKKLLNLNIE